MQRCSQPDKYMSFYFSVDTKECHCNTQQDDGAKTTPYSRLIYGITYERSQYLSFEQLHVLQERARDCLSLYQEGLSTNGVYVIYPVRGVPVEVWCDMTGGGWTVIQRRQDGSEDFFRGWDCYVKGFGNRTGEYWLGLENMWIMTTESTTLRIELDTFGDVTPVSAFAEYSNFAVGSSESLYQLKVSGFSGNCGDSLAYHNSKAFSTRDRDNDMNPTKSCAANYKGAWWYNSCHYSNLNGMYLGGVTSSADGIIWRYPYGYTYSFKTSVMKIRRNI